MKKTILILLATIGSYAYTNPIYDKWIHGDQGNYRRVTTDNYMYDNNISTIFIGGIPITIVPMTEDIKMYHYGSNFIIYFKDGNKIYVRGIEHVTDKCVRIFTMERSFKRVCNVKKIERFITGGE